MNTRLFFDIETRANPAALARLPEPEAPANYKDAAKIAAYLAEKKVQQAAQAALDPDTGYISPIAYQIGAGGEPQVRILVPVTSDLAGPVPDNVVLYTLGDIAALPADQPPARSKRRLTQAEVLSRFGLTVKSS
jgi:hypothetical protein